MSSTSVRGIPIQKSTRYIHSPYIVISHDVRSKYYSRFGVKYLLGPDYHIFKSLSERFCCWAGRTLAGICVGIWAVENWVSCGLSHGGYHESVTSYSPPTSKAQGSVIPISQPHTPLHETALHHSSASHSLAQQYVQFSNYLQLLVCVYITLCVRTYFRLVSTCVSCKSFESLHSVELEGTWILRVSRVCGCNTSFSDKWLAKKSQLISRSYVIMCSIIIMNEAQRLEPKSVHKMNHKVENRIRF